MSIRALWCAAMAFNWHLIQDLVDVWSALVAEHRRSRRCRVLLVDETSMRKRHRYVTVIVKTATPARSWPWSSIATLLRCQGSSSNKGHAGAEASKVVVSDGSKSYKAAIDKHLGHTRHVLDRFHVVRWFAAGLTLVRRDLQRRQPAGDQTGIRSRTCSEPVSRSYNEPTTSTNTTRPASRSSSRPTQGCEPVGRPSKSSTASISSRRPRWRTRSSRPVHRPLRHRRTR